MSALVELYEAFRFHLDFLRRILYPAGSAGRDLTGMHDLRAAIDKNLVFLDEDLATRIRQLEGELLLFWNWAAKERDRGEEGLESVRHRLDFEIPGYLDKLHDNRHDGSHCGLGEDPPLMTAAWSLPSGLNRPIPGRPEPSS